MTTPQEDFWSSDFGDKYTKRNFFTPGQMDDLYKARYGSSRMEMNEEFLAGLSLDRVLEVGTNMGAQLMLLQRRGLEGLYGIEINENAVRATRDQPSRLRPVRGSALKIPFADDSFDLVFTSGVLIHAFIFIPCEGLARRI